MKKVYERPLLKDHKLQHTNGLLVEASKQYLIDGEVDTEIGDDDDEVIEGL